jgi:hypothetical protein
MAKFAHGAYIEMGDGGTPETFTKVPKATDFALNPGAKEKIDTTNHDSTAKEHLQGLAEDGELSTEFNHDPSEPMHVALRAKHDEADPTNYKLHFASGVVAAFAATVNVTFTLGVNDAEKMAVSWAISGAVAYS